MSGKGINSNGVLGYYFKWRRASLRGQSLSRDLTEGIFLKKVDSAETQAVWVIHSFKKKWKNYAIWAYVTEQDLEWAKYFYEIYKLIHD